MTHSNRLLVVCLTALGFVVALLLHASPAWATPAGAAVTAPPVVAWKGKKKRKKRKKSPPKKKENGKKESKSAEPPADASGGSADSGADAGVPPADLGEAEGESDRKLPTRAERIGTGDVRTAGTAGTPLRQSNRMEFDARVVRGETAGSGAVILFERGPRHLATLTERRHIFLDATIQPVLGKKAAEAPRLKHGKSTDKKKPADKDQKEANK